MSVLHAFREEDVNISFIQSRPSKRCNWEYYFFVDVKGHQSDAAVQ